MDQLIPGLAALVEAFRDCFRPQVFQTFQALIAGWIVCLGPHTISEVWQATGWPPSGTTTPPTPSSTPPPGSGTTWASSWRP